MLLIYLSYDDDFLLLRHELYPLSQHTRIETQLLHNRFHFTSRVRAASSDVLVRDALARVHLVTTSALACAPLQGVSIEPRSACMKYECANLFSHLHIHSDTYTLAESICQCPRYAHGRRSSSASSVQIVLDHK